MNSKLSIKFKVRVEKSDREYGQKTYNHIKNDNSWLTIGNFLNYSVNHSNMGPIIW